MPQLCSTAVILATLVRDRNARALHQNRVGQILCTLQALAAAAALRDVLSRPIIAGL